MIVNNCSKDGSLEIARKYARNEKRISVHDNEETLEIITNHNHAFRQISPFTKYCRVVSADDVILPDCLRQMVEFAEAIPTVGIIGSYLRGSPFFGPKTGTFKVDRGLIEKLIVNVAGLFGAVGKSSTFFARLVQAVRGNH